MAGSPSVAEFFSGYIRRRLLIMAALIVFVMVSLTFSKFVKFLTGDSEEAKSSPLTISQVIERSQPRAGTEDICHGPRLSVEERNIAMENGYDIDPTLSCITKESYEYAQRSSK